jgi:hypothetical protein
MTKNKAAIINGFWRFTHSFFSPELTTSRSVFYHLNPFVCSPTL